MGGGAVAYRDPHKGSLLVQGADFEYPPAPHFGQQALLLCGIAAEWPR